MLPIPKSHMIRRRCHELVIIFLAVALAQSQESIAIEPVWVRVLALIPHRMTGYHQRRSPWDLKPIVQPQRLLCDPAHRDHPRWLEPLTLFEHTVHQLEVVEC